MNRPHLGKVKPHIATISGPYGPLFQLHDLPMKRQPLMTQQMLRAWADRVGPKWMKWRAEARRALYQ